MFEIIVFLFYSFLFCSSYAADAEELQKLFKIGLELQESNHLCPWGIDEESVQNKPIFSVKKGDRHLWDITIDWNDLEFVTNPFSNLEEDLFDSAIESIHIACDTLSALSKEFKETNGSVTFKKWRVLLQKKLNDLYIDLYTVDFTFDREGDALGSLMFPSTIDGSFTVKFQPQVTIQHKLTQTIPLVLGLCSSFLTQEHDGFCLNLGDPKDKQGIQQIIDEVINNCFPINTERQFECAKKTTPEKGFLFLHMLTCFGLVASIDSTQEEDNRVRQVLDWYEESGQVNAKALLGILSRRPFSLMWNEIKPGQSYLPLLEEHLSVESRQSLSERFCCINYGELYFNQDGSRCNLAPYFPDLVDGSTNQVLLEKGVLSTSMLRQSTLQSTTVTEAFSSYFDKMMRSIDGDDCINDNDVTNI
jgi:hypothetical protein